MHSDLLHFGQLIEGALRPGGFPDPGLGLLDVAYQHGILLAKARFFLERSRMIKELAAFGREFPPTPDWSNRSQPYSRISRKGQGSSPPKLNFPHPAPAMRR
jgi:hypothetical protein